MVGSVVIHLTNQILCKHIDINPLASYSPPHTHLELNIPHRVLQERYHIIIEKILEHPLKCMRMENKNPFTEIKLMSGSNK